MGRDRAHELEAERRPVVLCIPDQHRQKNNHRNQRRQPRPRAEQPAPPPVRHQRERRDRRQQHDRGEFRQHREAGEKARGEPPARIAALVQPHQRPQHRDRKRDHRGVGRDLRHQQPVIQRRFRHQHREHDSARIVRHAPDDVGEQQLRDQHRDDAAEPNAEIGVAEDRGAEPDQPGDAGRMIEEGRARSPSTRSSSRPRPCADRARRHRPAASPSARRSATLRQAMARQTARQAVRLLAVIGRGCRHGAFSSTRPSEVSTCRDGKNGLIGRRLRTFAGTTVRIVFTAGIKRYHRRY